jgi:hypothetical protein
MDNLIVFLTSGIIGGVVGTLFGGLSKFFWERWLPDRLTWQRDQRVRQRELLATYRDPAVRAISELHGRLYVILKGKAKNYFYVKKLGNEDYYIKSTAFYIAQYFAWSERMRSYIAALDYNELSLRLEAVSEAFAHGNPGFQLFAVEQREIGERLMKTTKENSDAIFHYSDFCDLLHSSEPPKIILDLQERVTELLENYEKKTPRETEIQRAKEVQHALVDLLDFVDPDHRWVRDERRKKFEPKEKTDEIKAEG